MNSAAAAELPVLDPETLETIAEGAGLEVALRIRDVFVTDLDRLSRELTQARMDGGLDSLHGVIHQVAGAAASFGAMRLALLSRRLDDLCARQKAIPQETDLSSLATLLTITRAASLQALEPAP